MTRFTIYLLIICILAALPLLAQEPQPLPPVVRYAVTPERVRVVVELPAPATFTETSTPTAAIVTLNTTLAAGVATLLVPNDPVVTTILLTPDANGQALLTVPLAQARKVKVFTLAAEENQPFRLVVDILKRFREESKKTLAPGIAYQRVEEQTDTVYRVTHLVNANLRDPKIHLRTVAGNGRERVSAMVTRAGAVCGINGGYFLTGTRPVGLLKTEGILKSFPIRARTAVAFPPNGLPVFGNPTGVWRLTLPDATTRDLPDVLDANILPTLPTAYVISGATFTAASANLTGMTVQVRDGQVLFAGPLFAPLSLTPGDTAIMLKGDDALALAPLLPVGAKVTVTPVLTPAWADYPDAVGGGPRLIQAGKVVNTGKDERFQPDVLTGRTARTALGLTADGHALLLTVEERGAYGGGSTLEELTQLLLAHGAVDAINFDGGGSTQLALGPDTVTQPTNTFIRPVADAVVITITP